MVNDQNPNVNGRARMWTRGPRQSAPTPAPEPTHQAIEHPLNGMLSSLRTGLDPGGQFAFVRAFMNRLLDAGIATEIERDGYLVQLQGAMQGLGYPRPRMAALREIFTQVVAERNPTTGPLTEGTLPAAGGWGEFEESPPITDGVTPPAGWHVGQDGVFQIGGGPGGGASGGLIRVCPAPVLITRRLIDAEGGQESVALTWMRDGRWKTKVVGRAILANKNKIIDLAADGFPVTCETSAKVVRFLAEFEAENLDRLPRETVSHALGWVDDRRSFLWGADQLRSGGTAAGGAIVQFQGAEAGDEQVARGFRAHGTWEGWRDDVLPYLHLPKIRLVLTASLAAPLLAVLKVPNAIVELCGETSGGKTVALRTAASCWGNPDERAPDAVMGTWDLTRVGAERTLTVINNMPLVLDDTQRARDEKLVGQVVYDLVAGRGRIRGNPKGLQSIGTWSTVLLSSGEVSLNDQNEKGGARARVISLWGSPFVEVSDGAGERAKALNRTVLAHYGHAGPRFVQFLLDRQSEWHNWNERKDAITREYTRRAANSPILNRMGDTFAVFALAGELAAAALDIPALSRRPVDELWAELSGEVRDGNVPTRALRFVYDWAVSRPNDFYTPTRSAHDYPQPHGGWVGRWDVGNSEWGFIAFMPHKLAEILKEHGFDFGATVRSWRDKGWLLTTTDGTHRQHRIEGAQIRLVTIHRGALDQLNAPAPEEQAPAVRPVVPARV